MRRFLAIGTLLAMSALAGCGKSSNTPPAAPSLPPPETFQFAPQPVSFSPPPAPWAAEGELSGGLRGVRYVKRGSVGEAIGIADYYDVSRRFQQASLDHLLTVNPDRDSFEFTYAMRNTGCRPDPYTDLEREMCVDLDGELRRARVARQMRDYDTVREAVTAARGHADRLQYVLADVIDRAIFKPEATANAQRYAFVGRRDATIGGEPAVVVDYTIDLPEGRRYIRKAYVMHNGNLFVADFIGLESSLPLFEMVVASISFPR